MNRLSLLFTFAILIAGLVAGGCKKDLEKEVVGTWNFSGASPMGGGNAFSKSSMAPQTVSMTFNADKTFTMQGGEGTWSMAGDKLSVKLTKIGGMTITQFKEFMGKFASSMADAAKSMAKDMPGGKTPAHQSTPDMDAKMKEAMDKIDQPMVFVVASDGKTAKPDTTTGMFSGTDSAKAADVTLTKAP